MGKLVEEGFKSGKLLAVEGACQALLARVLRQDTGTVTVKDGPFSESKEVIGGLAINSSELQGGSDPVRKRVSPRGRRWRM